MTSLRALLAGKTEMAGAIISLISVALAAHLFIGRNLIAIRVSIAKHRELTQSVMNQQSQIELLKNSDLKLAQINEATKHYDQRFATSNGDFSDMYDGLLSASTQHKLNLLQVQPLPVVHKPGITEI